MRLFVVFRRVAPAALLAFGVFTAIHAQASATASAPPVPPSFNSLAPFTFDSSGPVLRVSAQAQKPFTVAGPRGFLVGQQDGTLEAWVLPVKLLSHLTLEARIADYPVPIDVNRLAADVEVRADRTIITYSHIGFTVRQIMFSPPAADGAGVAKSTATGPVILYEFDCIHPTDFTFRFTPNLEWMWPARGEGGAGADWVSPDPRNANAAGGFYLLGANYPDLAAAVTIPGATPSTQSVYEDRPRGYPVEMTLHIDPARDRGRLFPLLMAVGMDRAAADSRALGQALVRLNQEIPALYQRQSEHYKKLLATATRIETPDKALDEAFEWSVISIDQLRTQVPFTATPKEFAGGAPETALVAGYFNSADSARPGFGWFFGRDALYTIPALNGYGDFALVRDQIEFLIHRQRADGKIMHEYSQTAAMVPEWGQFPYQWAAADSTPLFILALADYVRATGDVAFVAGHRDALEKAWAFETDAAHDTDHDGIYDNSQGTGWVESWPPAMPHQEIYLALLDQQASAAYGFLEKQLNDSTKSTAGEQRAAAVAKTINAEYYDAQKSCYGFSHDVAKDGTATLDRTSTVYPSLAWWSDLPGTTGNDGSILEHPEGCLRQLVGPALNTDWGLRDVANNEPIYDGMSYHQGSVWPLFTGWAVLAEYRANQPIAGYQLLKENALLTTAQDVGSHTEVLSGDFFVPTSRSTSHQLWSSAMIITPTLRGLFGISVDATTKTITVNPHLPAGWNEAAIRHLQLPGGSANLVLTRVGADLRVALSSDRALNGWRIRSDAPGARIDKDEEFGLILPLPLVEIGEPAQEAPAPGARSSAFRVLNEKWSTNKVTLTVEGVAGSTAVLPIQRHKLVKLGLQVDGGLSNVADDSHPGAVLSAVDTAWHDAGLPVGLWFHFPQGTGFQTVTVTVAW